MLTVKRLNKSIIQKSEQHNLKNNQKMLRDNLLNPDKTILF